MTKIKQSQIGNKSYERHNVKREQNEKEKTEEKQKWKERKRMKNIIK